MLIKELSLLDTIERKIQYIETSETYEDVELQNTKKGELEAYRDMKFDIAKMIESEFVKKYLKILKQLEEYFENITNCDDIENEKMEQLSGYNNSIVFILSLINPKYEFE